MRKIKIHLASYPSISDPHQLLVAPLFLVHNPRGIPQENFFPKFSINVRYKFNTSW